MIDSQLLERFVAQHDPSAFRDLVVRHGPSVLRACRRTLRDPHEAEDALQATFLILLRRAPSIRDPDRLDRWLVGVARRVALRLRRRGVTRSDRERRWAEMHPESREQDGPLFETRRVVREELARLPEVSRQSLTLCYLEGLTHEEAARRLGWPLGTVKVRLVRARRQLRERLDRRGIALSIAFLMLMLRRDVEASLASVTIESTVEAMTLAAASENDALRARFPRAFELSRSTSRLGGTASWRAVVVLALVFVLASTCGIALAQGARGSRELAVATAKLPKVLTVDCR